jgi:biotin carboxylase
MSIKKALIINIGWEQEPLIEHLVERGYLIFGIHYNELYNSSYKYESVLICDLRNLEKISEFAEKIKPDIVISDQCDYSHFSQAYISQRLHLPGPSIENAQISSNKYLQRLKAKAGGVLVPNFHMIANLQEVYTFVEQQSFPIILKPVDNRGSFGVVKVESKDEIPNAYFKALENSHSRMVIAEQFITGYEITVDGYCFNGEPHSLSLAKKNKGDLKVQVSMDIKYPGELPVDIYEKAMINNAFVNKQLGYKFGMTHSEYMVTENNEIYLVESANRGGGVFTSEIIVPNVCGIDLLEVYVNDVSGEIHHTNTIDVQRNPVILKFISFEPGIVKKIEGVEELLKDHSVLKLKLSIKPGDEIKPIETDANRHGFLIVKSQEDVRSKAQELINKIKVTYK